MSCFTEPAPGGLPPMLTLKPGLCPTRWDPICLRFSPKSPTEVLHSPGLQMLGTGPSLVMVFGAADASSWDSDNALAASGSHRLSERCTQNLKRELSSPIGVWTTFAPGISLAAPSSPRPSWSAWEDHGLMPCSPWWHALQSARCSMPHACIGAVTAWDHGPGWPLSSFSCNKRSVGATTSMPGNPSNAWSSLLWPTSEAG